MPDEQVRRREDRAEQREERRGPDEHDDEAEQEREGPGQHERDKQPGTRHEDDRGPATGITPMSVRLSSSIAAADGRLEPEDRGIDRGFMSCL
jgi:hypothetical protein